MVRRGNAIKLQAEADPVPPFRPPNEDTYEHLLTYGAVSPS
jgi:hypothetical protein